MRIIGMMLVKNEADRWLRQCLGNMVRICDKIVVLDDDSTDNTAEICTDYGCKVYASGESLWGENELIQRKRLFEYATKEAQDGDWLLCLDADELFVLNHIPYIQYVFNMVSSDIDGIAFKLYDMWGKNHYRDDKYWSAHKSFWTMAIRYKQGFNYQWHEKPLHCGRFPANSASRVMPTFIPIKHMGWSTLTDRLEKYNRYMNIDPEGKQGWLEQYRSILDEMPNLKKFYVECANLHECKKWK